MPTIVIKDCRVVPAGGITVTGVTSYVINDNRVVPGEGYVIRMTGN